MSDVIRRMCRLITQTCPACGVMHAYPEDLDATLRDQAGPDGKSVFCPNGHQWFYVDDEPAQ